MATTRPLADWRSLYIRKSYSLLAAVPELGIEIHGDDKCAVFFHGRAKKPDFHYSFASQARRDEKIDSYINSHRAHAERIAAERRQRADWQHGLKVGDVFRCVWGYEQTNVDYYEVVAVRGKAVDILEICAQSEENEGWMRGTSVPAPGHYKKEPDYESEESKAHHATTGHYLTRVPKPRRMIPQAGYKGEPTLAIHSFASASLIRPTEVAPGVKVFEPDHWTAYA